jgi:hypothetical protein
MRAGDLVGAWFPSHKWRRRRPVSRDSDGRAATDPPTDSKYDLAGVPDPAEKTTMTTFVKALRGLRGSNLHDAVRTRSVAGQSVVTRAIREGWRIMKDTAYGFVADEALSRGVAIAAHGAWPPRIAIGALGAGASPTGEED